MRQIGQWGLQYANDWGGILPTTFIDAGGFGNITPAPPAGVGGAGDDSVIKGDCGWNHMTYGVSYPAQEGYWSMKAGQPYSLYTRNLAGTKTDLNSALVCPLAGYQFNIDRNISLGSTYSLNQYLGGQWKFTVSTVVLWAPLPKISLLHADTYWFAEAGIRNISGLYDYNNCVMPLGTSGNTATNPIVATFYWPWPWDYSDQGPAYNPGVANAEAIRVTRRIFCTATGMLSHWCAVTSPT